VIELKSAGEIAALREAGRLVARALAEIRTAAVVGVSLRELDEVAAGVIAGPINTVAEVVNDPQLRARGMLADHWDERIGRNVLGPGVIPVLSETPGTIRNAGSSRPGQHNDEVYGELLGRSADELETLRKEGVL